MDTADIKVVYMFATDVRFREEFSTDPAGALRRHGIELYEETLTTLTELAGGVDQKALHWPHGMGRWFEYRDLTPSAFGVK